jgi:hypothetical protein
LIICCLLLGLAPVLTGQNKALRHEMELKQFAHLQQGIILIPLLDEPKSPGIASRRDPEFNRIREHNSAVISSFTNFFSFTRVGFFFESTREKITEMQLKDVVFDGGRMPITNLPQKAELIFLATFYDEHVQIPVEVRALGSKYARRYEKAERKNSSSNEKKTDRAKAKACKLAERIETNKYSWNTKRYVRATDRLNYYEHVMAPTDFDRLYSYFTADNLDCGGIVVSAIQPATHVKNTRLSYEFNYSYRARLHETSSVIRQFEEAVQQLQRNLELKKAEIEKSLVSKF